MDTMEMITKALEAVVEQKVAEKATTVNLDSVLEFIKNASSEDIEAIFTAVCDSENGDRLLDDYYYDRLSNDDLVINKDELTVSDVDDAGLLEDCFNEYFTNACDQKSMIKDLIDNL